MPPIRQYGKKKAGGSAAAAKIFGSTVVGDNKPLPEQSVASARSPLVDITLALGNLNIESQDAGIGAKSISGKQIPKHADSGDTTIKSQVALASPKLISIHHRSRIDQKESSIIDQEFSSLRALNQTTQSTSSDDEQEIYSSDLQSSGKFSNSQAIYIAPSNNDLTFN